MIKVRRGVCPQERHISFRAADQHLDIAQGWDEGLKGMAAGGERKLTIPAPLAYGKKGVDGIPGGATLSFDVKLLASACP